jgi:hypothetical protein
MSDRPSSGLLLLLLAAAVLTIMCWRWVLIVLAAVVVVVLLYGAITIMQQLSNADRPTFWWNGLNRVTDRPGLCRDR